MRNLTNFTFLIDTPLTDFKNTIYFPSNSARDSFFDSHYSQLQYQADFNYIRDRGSVRIPQKFWNMQGVNYCYFESEFEPGKRIYTFVVDYRYLNDNTIELTLVIDTVMTYCQGQVLNNLRGLTIHRQHLTSGEYNTYLPLLKNNNDVLTCTSKRYFEEKSLLFSEHTILIHSTANLNGSFGDEDSPNIETPKGANFDKLQSPVDLYIIPANRFETVMTRLEKFPWITQNFTKILLIPKFMLDSAMTSLNTVAVSNSDVDLSDVKKITSGFAQRANTALDTLNYTMAELYNKYGLATNEKHLLRSEYATCEVTNYTGGLLPIDFGKLHESKGLEFGLEMVAGYANELVIFPQAYNTYTAGNFTAGNFINNGLYFKNFDSVPILIDNYSLALAKSANMRGYGEENLFTNRLKSIAAVDTPLQDRFSHALNIASNVNPIQIAGRLSDQFDFYRQQKAEFADLALNSPTITAQTTDNALMIKNNHYGVHLKMSRPEDVELNEIKKYYKLFGFQIDKSNSQLSNTFSQTICNYVQFEGTYNIDGIPDYLFNALKLQFENGVRLWHSNNSDNPFSRDILQNRWR